MAEKATSLGKSIRSSGETDQIDLGGCSDAFCADLCAVAFAEPIRVPAGTKVRCRRGGRRLLLLSGVAMLRGRCALRARGANGRARAACALLPLACWPLGLPPRAGGAGTHAAGWRAGVVGSEACQPRPCLVPWPPMGLWAPLCSKQPPRESVVLDERSREPLEAPADCAAHSSRPPLSLPHRPSPCQMIRLSFVVGGGKKVRQKYSDSLPRALSDALVAVGYAEDRGASLDPSSAGTFKLQHDTDKDLKFMHVFPRVAQASAADGDEDEDEDEGARLLRMSPAERCCVCTAAELEELVPVVAKQFAAKRSLLAALKARLKESEALEAKMAAGEVLSEAENERYEGGVELSDKAAWVQKMCEKMIDTGKLTEREKKGVIVQLDEKIAAASQALEAAAGNAKRAEKLGKVVEGLKEKRTAVADITPTVHALSNAARLVKLYKELAELEAIENARGMQSMAVLTRLNKKPDVEEEVAALEDACYGWFDDDTDTASQLKQLKKNATARKGKASGGTGSGSAAKTYQATQGWTPASSSRGGAKGGGKPKAKKSGGAFDALGDFMDASQW